MNTFYKNLFSTLNKYVVDHCPLDWLPADRFSFYKTTI